MQYESAGQRRDGGISREGSVELAARADRPRDRAVARRPARQRLRPRLRARGKNGGVIACAMAHRANRIAYALVRDQTGYDPDPLGLTTPRGLPDSGQTAGAKERSRWSARSAARTNDVDRDESRRTHRAAEEAAERR